MITQLKSLVVLSVLFVALIFASGCCCGPECCHHHHTCCKPDPCCDSGCDQAASCNQCQGAPSELIAPGIPQTQDPLRPQTPQSPSDIDELPLPNGQSGELILPNGVKYRRVPRSAGDKSVSVLR